jgi:hypothetical protein
MACADGHPLKAAPRVTNDCFTHWSTVGSVVLPPDTGGCRADLEHAASPRLTTAGTRSSPSTRLVCGAHTLKQLQISLRTNSTTPTCSMCAVLGGQPPSSPSLTSTRPPTVSPSLSLRPLRAAGRVTGGLLSREQRGPGKTAQTNEKKTRKRHAPSLTTGSQPACAGRSLWLKRDSAQHLGASPIPGPRRCLPAPAPPSLS